MIRPRPHPATLYALFASVIAVLSGSVVNIALPVMGCSLHAAPAQLPWIVSAYLLALGAMLPFGGLLGDRLGRHKLLDTGVVLLVGASLICAVASGLGVLLAGRLLQGIGAALILPNAVAIIGISDRRRASPRLAIYSAACTAASGVGPVVGSWLAGCDNWRFLFEATAIGAAAVALAYRLHQSTALVPDCDAAADADCRVTIAEPTLPAARVLLSPGMLSLTVFTLLLYGAFFGLLLLLPVALVRGGGYAPAQAGAALLPLSLFPLLLAPLVGRAQRRCASIILLATSIAPICVALLMLLNADLTGRYATQVLPALLLMAVGMSLAAAPLTATVLAMAGQAHAGLAAGLNSAAARLGGAAATAMLGPLFAAASVDLPNLVRQAIGVDLVLAVLAGVAAATLLITQRPSRTGRSVTSQPQGAL